MQYEIIIIGSGLGGLTAGAKLSREGKKVLVLEQHNRPGGCATTFRRGDFILEVGLHEMDGPSPRDMKTRIFNDLDVFSNVEFLRIPEFYRFISNSYSVTIPHDPVQAAEILTGLFPGDAPGIRAYYDTVLNPKKRQQEGHKEDISIGHFLDSILKNEDLKLILLGNLGYFHDDPYTLSLAYYSVAQGSYYTNGASFVKGGSQKLSDHLSSFIRTKGGEVLLSHQAVEIRMKDGKAVSVVARRKKDGSLFEYNADEIIVNSAIPNLSQLLPDDGWNPIGEEIKDMRAGASLLTVYYGFRKPLKSIGHNFYSVFVYDRSVRSQLDIKINNRDDFSRRSFTFVDYGQIDSELASGGKSVGAVCCIDYLADWENLGREEYEARKAYAAGAFTSRLEYLIPGFSNLVEYCEVGTPATVKRYTLNPEGAVYGFAQNPSKKQTDSLKQPDNIHFASAWGKTGGGFSGAIYGGYLCAMNILRKRK